MIYLDNAATTWPKPSVVGDAVSRAIIEFGANPGRSGHKMSINTAEQIFLAREKIAQMFGVSDCENVIFTANCTHAANIVIKGVLKSGDHAVCSELDHNAVMRPLHQLSRKGVMHSVAQVYDDDRETINSFLKRIGKRTKLVVCTHASNVNGKKLPIAELGKMCHELGILFAVDAAQTAGVFDIDVVRDNIDYLFLAGHKGLYGPMGTGVLIVNNNEVIIESLITGGTGSASADPNQPDFLPDRFESGTANVSGICGLHAGINFINQVGLSTIQTHEFEVAKRLYNGIKDIDGVKILSDFPDCDKNAPIVSVNYKDVPSEVIATSLGEMGIAVRAGMHCAPSAHKAMGTLEQGVVRFSPSVFTSFKEIDICIQSLKKICIDA